MGVVISDEIIEASQLTRAEFLQEMALYLFQSGRLTVGYASQMAQMDQLGFKALLKARQTPLYVYDTEDFEIDLKSLQALNNVSLG
ncbi:MAG: UPF0175 family protein [Phormidesmis sp.]